MKKIIWLLFPLLAVGLVITAVLAPRAATAEPANQMVALPGPTRLIRLDPRVRQRYVAPPAIFSENRRWPERVATATIVVNYNGGGWTAEAQSAFEYAAGIWETLITSPVPIVVDAQFGPLGTGILGGAGPTKISRDFPNAPQANTWYPVATANKLANTDLDPLGADINATFSSTYPDWYFGTDNATPVDKINFVSVVLHELGHGLGFLGSMRIDDGVGNVECLGVAGRGCYGYGNPTFPMIYDRYAENGAGTALLSYQNNSTDLAAQLTSNSVYFDSPGADFANSGSRVPLYAPSTWSPGSSYSHLSESYNSTAHSLMTFSISKGETIHNPGSVTLCMFRDMGWTVYQNCSPGGFSLLNGDFEDGPVSWTQSSALGYPLIVDENDPGLGSVTPHGGSWLSWLGGGNSELAYLEQPVSLPGGDVYLNFWQRITSNETGCSNDFGWVKINGSIVATFGLCQANATGGWVPISVDLSAYGSQTVDLRFELQTNGSLSSSMFLDDVAIQADSLIAGLTAENDSPTVLGQTTHFTATVTAGTNVAYAWDFGDGQGAIGATASHIYGNSGTYTATVTAINPVGQATAATVVTVPDVPIEGLTAGNDSPTALGEATHFSASVAAGTNVAYAWDFGDESFGSGATPSHIYGAAGVYTATVTASNSAGQAITTTLVSVESMAIEGLSAANDSPTALGQATHFTATITAGTSVTYTWDFGDESFGSGATTGHIYDAPGMYTATVTATNSFNQMSASTTVQVKLVISGLEAESDSPTILGQATHFTATVTAGENISYTWDFGDESYGSGATVAHTYTTPGVYTAIVTATNSTSQASASTVVHIDSVIGGLTAINDSPTLWGTSTQLTATVTAGSNVVYGWDFGDETYGSGASVAHTYAAPGVYTATVTASNSVSQFQAVTLVEVKMADFSIYLPGIIKP